MTNAALHSAVAPLEPSFRAHGERGGTFDLEGRHVVLSLAPDGWLTAAARVGGSPEALLRRQAGILGLAKAAAGPSLRADMPAAGSLGETFTALRDALEVGLATLGDKPAPPAQTPGAQGEVKDIMDSYASSSPWEWRRRRGRWSSLVETPRGQQWIVAEVTKGCLRLASPLVRLCDPHPASRAALAHFLLALNARLRLARGALLDSGVELEAILPAQHVSSRLIDKAEGALIVGASLTERECTALLEPALGDAYRAFHERR